MTQDRWERLQALFEAASDMAPAARARFLERECGEDLELRDELEALLRHAASNGVELPEIVQSAATDLMGGQPDPWVGSVVGRYRIKEKIAEGGMGAVYRGERADETYEQDVAIKLLGSGLVSRTLQQRFVNERQILANLNHPHIATLIDGGAADNGVPYLVMEHVEGVPIDQYCDAARLTNRERLELFVQVCGAVQYAHQNLIVHRDIKPGNILVTTDGTPKLLDFGIAKLLSDEQTAGQTMALTRADTRLLTPEYASPEQIRGGAITTATDIYTLGLLLYELLSGHRPFDVNGLGPADLERTICTTEPERPSALLSHADASEPARNRATSVDGLRRQLMGDLDNIVLLALRKEPQLRYGSAQQLAEDIQRYLDNRPIRARSASAGYRVKKFIERNRLPVASALTMLVLTIGLVTYYTVQLAAQRDAANRERDAAEAVTDFLVGIFEVSDPSEARGSSITAREVLDRGNARLAIELQEQPAVRARLLDSIGRVYMGLGLYGDARDRFQEAVELKSATGVPEADVVATMRREAAALMSFGDSRAATLMLQEILAIQQRLLPPGDVEIVRTHRTLGEALFNQGEVAAAIEQCGLAAELGAGQTDVEIRVVSQALLCLGTAHLSRRETEIATGYLERANDLLTERFGSDFPDLLDVRHELAGAYFMRGDYQPAIAIWLQVAEGQKHTLGEHHANVGRTWGSIGAAYWGLAENDKAEHAARTAISIFEKTLPPQHRDFGKTYYLLAGLLRAQFSYPESESLYRRVVEIQRSIAEPNDPDLGNTLAEMAVVLTALAQFEEAEASLRESIAIQEVSLGRTHLWVALSLGQLGDLHVMRGSAEEGLALTEDALARALQSAAPDHHHVTTIRRYRGVALSAVGRREEALEVFDRCVDSYRSHYGARNPRFATVLVERAAVLIDSGQAERAQRDVAEAISIQAEAFGADHPGLGRSYFELARARLAAGHEAQARADAERAHRLMSSVQPDRHPSVRASRELLESI